MFSQIVASASEETGFRPTFIEIYDFSSTGLCDRLFIVQPFGFYILNVDRTVYVLDGVAANCGIGKTPIIKIQVENEYKIECTNSPLDEIIARYKTKPPRILYYDIHAGMHTNKFTVLDAINLLFDGYIDMNLEEDTSEAGIDIYKLQQLVYRSPNTRAAKYQTNLNRQRYRDTLSKLKNNGR